MRDVFAVGAMKAVMTSQKQLEANRRNARRSTGPKSAAGKTRAAGNALKHGLRAEQVVVAGEDAEAFDDLLALMHDEFQPQGVLELQLVERIAACTWRLRRAYRIEAEILEYQKAKSRLEVVEDRMNKQVYGRYLLPSDFTQDDHDNLKRLRVRARHARKEANLNRATLGGAFYDDSVNASALSKLSRYETSIERALYRALHELQRLQSFRDKGTASTQVVIDVDREDQAAKKPSRCSRSNLEKSVSEKRTVRRRSRAFD